MIETLVGIGTLIGFTVAFYKSAWPHVVRLYRRIRDKPPTISVSLDDKRILTSDEDLRKIVIEAKRDAYLDKKCKMLVVDSKIEQLQKDLPKLKPVNQPDMARYIRWRREKLALYSKAVSILFDKSTLDMLMPWAPSTERLIDIVKGTFHCLLQGEVSGLTKFEFWIPNQPKYGYGIWVSHEYRDAILSKVGASTVRQMYPGALYADELPPEVILMHVIPRILEDLATRDEPVSEKEKATALSLFAYHVGPG